MGTTSKLWGSFLVCSGLLSAGCRLSQPIPPPAPKQPDRLWSFNLEPGVLLQAEDTLKSRKVLVLQKDSGKFRIRPGCSLSGVLRRQPNSWTETTEIASSEQLDASLIGNVGLWERARVEVARGDALLLRMVGVSSYVANVAGGKAIPWTSLQAKEPNGCDGATHLVVLGHLGAAQLRTARQEGGGIGLGPVSFGKSSSQTFDERLGEPDRCAPGAQGQECQRLIAMDLVPIANTPSSKVSRQACDERDEMACVQSCNAGSGEACNNVGYILETGAPSVPQQQRLPLAARYYQQACLQKSLKGCANAQRLRLASPNPAEKEAALNTLSMFCDQNVDFACEVVAREKLDRGDKGVALGVRQGVSFDPIGTLRSISGTANHVQEGLRLLQRACSLGNGEACYELRHRAARPVGNP